MIYHKAWRIHIHREGLFVVWWVRHFDGRSAQGRAFTHGGAKRAAMYAIGDFVQGLLDA